MLRCQQAQPVPSGWLGWAWRRLYSQCCTSHCTATFTSNCICEITQLARTHTTKPLDPRISSSRRDL